MKLQDNINRRVGDKEYRRWYVNLSKEQVDALQWTKGQDLDSKIVGDKLILKPSTKLY